MTLVLFTILQTPSTALASSTDNTISSSHSVVQLQKELAALGYLPLTDTFQWRFNEPPTLKSLWKEGSYNVMTKGAVMEFQSMSHLVVDGITGPQTWRALDNAYQKKKMNPDGYTYVVVSEKSPETLQVWHDGKLVLTSLANTGIAQMPTVLGTFPVYLRYLSQTMSGTNPDGTHYSDPGVPYVNYFNGGDAIHGFTRKSYGFPQSLGCVELPVAQAKIAWNYIHYGTLVTVQTTAVPTPNGGDSSSAATANTLYPTLHEGMNNEYVVQLQQGLGLTADGVFGLQTLDAVKQFQKAHGLVADGIVGPNTWHILMS
jgi:peptidoglycan hydrolase-like protein with peptidoglycan-binding domain